MTWCLALISIALAYSVLQSGGVILVDWNVSLLLIGLGGLVYWLRARSADSQPAMKSDWRWALLFPGYAALQLVPLPISVLRILSPARARVLEWFATLTHPVRFASLSVNAETTFVFLFRVIGYTLIFLLVREIAAQTAKRRPWLPVIPLISIAAVEAGVALWQNAQGTDVEGTYANWNHLAGLLEMVIPLTLACGFALLRDTLQRRSPQMRRVLQSGALLALGLAMFGALMSSLSKMGFAAGLAGVFVMAVAAVATRLRAWQKWVVLAGLTALFVFVFIFLPPDALIDRFAGVLSGQQPAAEGRGPIARDTLHLIAAFPALGCGLGTYGTAFLKYQTSILDFVFTYAHNDYLQLAAELGVIGFLLLAVIVARVMGKAFRAARRTHPNTRYLALGCVGAFTAIGLHSLMDFNLYIPANALVLAWILGLSAQLDSAAAKEPAKGPSRRLRFAAVLAVLLIVYAPVWILFDHLYRSDVRWEPIFCTVGICDTDAVATAQMLAHGGQIAAVPSSELLRVVRSESNDPDRWCDLGESLLRSGRVAEARFCFSKALDLGPRLPTIHLRTSDFYYQLHDTIGALQQRSRILSATEAYDSLIFDWYTAKKLTLDDILVYGLPDDRRAFQAYLRYLISAGRQPEATKTWQAVCAHGYADDGLANAYVQMLFDAQMYEAAAASWGNFLGARREGYGETNRVYNGDFESAPSPSAFDWRIDDRNDVEVTRDAGVAHTGSHSLRIRFNGQGNVDYNGTSQTAYVRPGTYRFEAFVRTEDITTDQGIGFRIVDPEAPNKLDAFTERLRGSHDWQKVERLITVAKGTRLLQIRIIRQPSLRFDNRINGTAWIDSVKLTPVAGPAGF